MRTFEVWVVKTVTGEVEMQPGKKMPKPYVESWMDNAVASYDKGFDSPVVAACKWWAARFFGPLKVGVVTRVKITVEDA